MPIFSILTSNLNSNLINPNALRTSIDNGATQDAILILDVLKSITPNYEAEVSEFPVEGDSDISDHIKLKNVSLDIEGYISETPLTLNASISGAISAAAGAVGGLAGGLIGASALGSAVGSVAGGIGASLLGKSDNPADKARDYLISLISSRKTFTLTTPARRFEMMVITKLSFPKDKDTGRGIKFMMTLKQIRIVSSAFIFISQIDKSIMHSATKAADKGKQSPKKDERGTSAAVFLGKSVGLLK